MSEEAPPPLSVEVELTAEDVVRAHFWTLLQLPAVKFLIVINGLLFLSFVLLAVRAFVRNENALAFAAGVPLLLLVFGAFPFQVRRRARQRFASLEPDRWRGTYTFTKDGFAWTLGRAPARAPWAAVSRVQETTDYVFLMTPSGRTHVLPKRCLEDETAAVMARWREAAAD